VKTDKFNWSQAFPLDPISDWPTGRLNDQAGVYRIRAFSKGGTPQSIRRFNGEDPEGLLHIGMSGDLFKRLRSFHKGVIREEFPAHFASSEFVKWGFKKLVPARLLRFDFIATVDNAAARTLETELHRAYRYKFLDRPPLDGTSGERFKIGS
jgi:hypothetical protein